MIVILKPNIDEHHELYKKVHDHLSQLPGISINEHQEHGIQQVLT